MTSLDPTGFGTLRRVRREKRTIGVMIAMYCRRHHAGSSLCDDCRELHDYAMLRIDKCPYCFEKPTCANCPIHCYKKDMRARVKEVMRYAGPRMLLRHPYLAIMHQIDGRREVGMPAPRTRRPASSEAAATQPEQQRSA